MTKTPNIFKIMQEMRSEQAQKPTGQRAFEPTEKFGRELDQVEAVFKKIK